MKYKTQCSRYYQTGCTVDLRALCLSTALSHSPPYVIVLQRSSKWSVLPYNPCDSKSHFPISLSCLLAFPTQVFWSRMNVVKVLRACEKALLWNETVYLYKVCSVPPVS